jgi:hypothetical protein
MLQSILYEFIGGGGRQAGNRRKAGRESHCQLQQRRERAAGGAADPIGSTLHRREGEREGAVINSTHATQRNTTQ